MKSNSIARRAANHRARGKVKVDPLRKLGEAIRRLRRQRKMSQVALADRADMHRTYICHIERGERDIPLSSLANLAQALGTSISNLTTGIK